MNMLRAITLGGLAVGALMATSAIAPASARHWHGHGYGPHWQPYHYWAPPVVVYAPRPYYYRPAPPVVYAPPPVYYAPRAYYAPRPYYRPGVSVGIGLNLR
jgi:hypothetical protein